MNTILSSPLLKLPQASPRGERPTRRRKTVEVFTYGKIGETGNERDEAAQACTQGRESNLELDAAGAMGGLLRALMPSTVNSVDPLRPSKASVSARGHHIVSQGLRRSPSGQLGSPEGQPDEQSSKHLANRGNPRTEALFDAARHEKQMAIVCPPPPVAIESVSKKI
jgi:hypothetical protein